MSVSPHPWPAFGSRPLLGANGTEAMQAILPDGAVLVDYLKVGPFMGEQAIATLAQDYPLMLHLDDTLSSHELPSANMIQRLIGWIELTGAPWTSEHIGFSVADIDLDSALITQPTSALLTRQQAFDNIVRNARALARALPIPLLLENIPLFPNMAHLWVCEPDFVAEVISATNCNLLVDLAHARVTSDVLGIDVHDYLSQLPLQRAVEVHLSGPRPLGAVNDRRQALVRENAQSIAHILSFNDHNLIDQHASMQEEDYDLLEWLLARSEPKAISLEYFADPEALREQLVRLNAMIGR